MTTSPPPPPSGGAPDRPPFQPSASGVPSWGQPPGFVSAVRVLLFITAALWVLVAVLRFVATWPTGAEATARAYGAATGNALFPLLLAFFGWLLARRLEQGRRSTRIWTNVVTVLTILMSLSVVATLPGLVILSLPLLGLSIAVLVLINLADARRFFTQRSGS